MLIPWSKGCCCCAKWPAFGQIKCICTSTEALDVIKFCPVYYHEIILEVWLIGNCKSLLLHKISKMMQYLSRSFSQNGWPLHLTTSDSHKFNNSTKTVSMGCNFQNHTLLKIPKIWQDWFHRRGSLVCDLYAYTECIIYTVVSLMYSLMWSTFVECAQMFDSGQTNLRVDLRHPSFWWACLIMLTIAFESEISRSLPLTLLPSC